MSIALSSFRAAIGRKLSKMLSSADVDAGFDPYEPEPVTAEALKDMFKNADGAPWAPQSDLRASERREMDSMSLIRGALYPAD